MSPDTLAKYLAVVLLFLFGIGGGVITGYDLLSGIAVPPLLVSVDGALLLIASHVAGVSVGVANLANQTMATKAPPVAQADLDHPSQQATAKIAAQAPKP